ncbi:calpain-A isoform X2 [Calliphora vicina]|uniref:calpain-A isoform X2 n=1 Tax=Calliphora vicina TaxID=7373 RepID=UPI00325B851D
MDEIKGFFRQAGKEFLNAAGDAAMGAAKDVMGSVINEIFIKKEAETKRILPSIKNMKVLGDKPLGSHRPHTEIQDFETTRQQCLENGSLFEDPLFTASNESLMFSKRPDRHIEWLRPHEIADDPQFFVEGYSRFDVQQGELGDCWLLAAAANLTQDSNLFFRVVPPDQSFEDGYAGVFHFCFWQYGKWIDVVVDDRLPTYRGELMYMHSAEKNEFWSALLEKAYAKLHGSYEALKGGSTCEAMEDFTGGVTEWYDLKEAPSNLFNILAKAGERNSMMGCSLEADPNVLEAETPEGLIRGHAYSITKVCMIDIVTPNRQGRIPMIRLRNPWGNEAEWNGPWSDSSPEWRYIPDEQKHEIGLNFDRDGEFWMSFQDFLNHFERVEICNLSPDSLTESQQNDGKRKWEMSMFEGEWTPGVTAGGCRNFLDTFWHNPQYVISLEDPDEEDDDGKCTVIVALMQKNRRSKRNLGMECLTIGFAIYHLNERDLQTRPQGLGFFKYKASVARSPHFINTREVTARFRLPPGHYLIIPSTFDPNEDGEFIIRVFSETQNNMEENDDHVGYSDADNDVKPPLYPSMPSPVKPVDPQREALQRLFNSVAGADMEVDWMELKRILDHSLRDVMMACPEGFSKDVCRAMVAMLDADKSGKLGFEEFEALLTDIAKWKAVFKMYDVYQTGRIDGFQLRTALNSAGYHLNNSILNALVHRYGSRDGKIAFDDFLMCAVKIKTYMDIFKDKDTENTQTATFTMDEWIESTIYS